MNLLRRDDALSLLRRVAAKPVPIGPSFDSPSSAYNSLKAGDIQVGLSLPPPYLHRTSEVAVHHPPAPVDPMQAYVLSVLANHVSALKAMGPSGEPELEGGSQVAWITLPGSRAPLPANLVASIEVAITRNLTNLQCSKQQQQQHVGLSRGWAKTVPSSCSQGRLQSLVLEACSLVTIRSPTSVATAMDAIRAPFKTVAPQTVTKANSDKAVSLVIVSGLGYFESVIQLAERHLGAAAPLRSALSDLLSTRASAVILVEVASRPGPTPPTHGNAHSSLSHVQDALSRSFVYQALCSGTPHNSAAANRHNGDVADDTRNARIACPYFNHPDSFASARVARMLAGERLREDGEGEVPGGGRSVPSSRLHAAAPLQMQYAVIADYPHQQPGDGGEGRPPPASVELFSVTFKTFNQTTRMEFTPLL